MEKYICSICGLHYEGKEMAEKCFQWCSHHESCNLGIAENSVEAVENRKKSNKNQKN
ncbi:hypothetical protein M1141_00905 [Candidatus Marsarchaeota archaeon]|nr:hypothetical protein [Candidatus Marsarchaeota archaeon]